MITSSRRRRISDEQSGSWSMGFYGSAVMALIAAAMAVGLRAQRARTRGAPSSDSLLRNQARRVDLVGLREQFRNRSCFNRL